MLYFAKNNRPGNYRRPGQVPQKIRGLDPWLLETENIRFCLVTIVIFLRQSWAQLCYQLRRVGPKIRVCLCIVFCICLVKFSIVSCSIFILYFIFVPCVRFYIIKYYVICKQSTGYNPVLIAWRRALLFRHNTPVWRTDTAPQHAYASCGKNNCKLTS